MKSKHTLIIGLLALGLAMGFSLKARADAQQTIRYSSSAQVHAILTDDMLAAFTRETGIGVDLYVCSSEAALHRLYNRVSDVASTGEHIYFPEGDYGYMETPLFKAPLVVITHKGNAVETLTENQLRDIFSGRVTNWKAVGGPDQAIVVIVPGKNTAAFRNFSMLALRRVDISYAIMTYQSTMVVETVGYIPWSISFITKGSGQRDAAVKILKVIGHAHTDAAYPYFQEFSMVTKGQPAGAVKNFLGYLTSDRIMASLKSQGVVPLK